MFELKLCGVTCVEDALHAGTVGFDAIGLILCPSPRRITLEAADRISREVKDRFGTSMEVFAVVQDPSQAELEVLLSIGAFDGLQVYGEGGLNLIKEAGFMAIKAILVSGIDDVKGAYRAAEGADMILFDAPKVGKAPFDWSLLKAYEGPVPFGVAGGVTAENLCLLVDFEPCAVDVCSSVELYPGKKDPEKVREFAERFNLTLGGFHRRRCFGR